MQEILSESGIWYLTCGAGEAAGKRYLAVRRCTDPPRGRAWSWPFGSLSLDTQTPQLQTGQSYCSAGIVEGWSWIAPGLSVKGHSTVVITRSTEIRCGKWNMLWLPTLQHTVIRFPVSPPKGFPECCRLCPLITFPNSNIAAAVEACF